MFLGSKFDGKIVQVIESLDFGDAVSNQAIALDGILRRNAVATDIFTRWHHQKVEHLRKDLYSLDVNERDVVIYHFSGFSEYSLPHLATFPCTKVCLYHNITPHDFFDESTQLYEYCLKGRTQLRETIGTFHYFWGDSSYNIQELKDLGANPEKCFVLPIIVEATARKAPAPARDAGSWLFVGRIAANKGHLQLVELFARVRKNNPTIARRLCLVGNFNDGDPYYQSVLDQIERHGLSGAVELTGKVPDVEVERHFAETSIYVSASQHEGFGVPLIEAAVRNVPVAAISNTAVSETLGFGSGVAHSIEELEELVARILADDEYRDSLMDEQRRNAGRFTTSAVEERLFYALRAVLPSAARFATVSVVVCTLDRKDLLERCLDYLQHQSNSAFEVIIVDGPSSDGTRQFLQACGPNIKVGCNTRRNLAVSRNMGIELAAGDIIAFIDDDALPFDDWIENILGEFSRHPVTVAALGGPAYYAGTLRFQSEDIGINRFAEAKVNIDPREIGREGWARSLLGTNTCFRADVLREVGGFDEQFDYFLDESELCFRLQSRNHLVAYCPEVIVRHEFAQSSNRQGKHKYNWRSICKNTAYFIGAYSRLRTDALRPFVQERMAQERVLPLRKARESGEIDARELLQFEREIAEGIEQGLADVAKFPQVRSMRPDGARFQPYTYSRPYPQPGRGLRQLHVCILSKEFTGYSARGGVGTLYYHLASELLLMGHRVTLISSGAADHWHQQGRFRIKYALHKSFLNDENVGGPGGFVRNLEWSMLGLREIADLHERDPIDIVESSLWDAEALMFSLIEPARRPPLVVRLVSPFPVVARMNSWKISSHDAELFVGAERKLIECADAVVPISESIARSIESEHGVLRDSRWHIDHCGIAYWPSFDNSLNYAELREIDGRPFEIEERMKLVLFVGRLEGRKGISVLLEAANEFLAGDPWAVLLVAGRDIEDWAARGKSILSSIVRERVHFLGEISDAAREKLLNAAYCVIFPSRYESFGLVPLEAFVHGTPVVAARAGAIPEVVSEGHCGLLFEPDDPLALARCVSVLLHDVDLRARLSAGARQQARKFGSRASAIRSVALYASLQVVRRGPAVAP